MDNGSYHYKNHKSWILQLLHTITSQGALTHWSPQKYPRGRIFGGVPVLENSYAFNGFARAGGIDMTEDGIVGTLCAKLWHHGLKMLKWVAAIYPLVI